MNMQLLEPIRKKQKVGDIFAIKILPDEYHYGRVIIGHASVGGFDNCLLLYFYRATSPVRDQVPELRRDDLLIPPQATNRQGWLKGYFFTVESRPLTKDDILPVHCFKDYRGRYFDDQNHDLPGAIEPVGEWGLGSYRTIDDELSKALGLPIEPY